MDNAADNGSARMARDSGNSGMGGVARHHGNGDRGGASAASGDGVLNAAMDRDDNLVGAPGERTSRGAVVADVDAGGSHQRVVSLPRRSLPTPAASEAAAFLSMLDRIARDPSVDIERIERMTTLYERSVARSAKAAYDAALSEMQPKLPIIDKRGKGHNGAKYALWEDIAEGILSVTAEHGFSLTFRVQPLDKAVNVTAVLAHRDGHREETAFPFPLDATGNKSPIQSVGSSISYGKRYTACALLNVIAHGEDDDGKSGSKQMSSSAAKKNGTDRRFNEIVAEFRSALNVDHLRHIAEVRREEIDALPFRWRDLARDEYELALDQLRGR